MATDNGQVPGKKRIVKSTELQHIDHHCCVCERKKAKRIAEHYCVSCQDFYCKKCVKIHVDVPSLSTHVILDKSSFKNVSRVRQLPSIPTERCVDHSSKIINMYCETHKEVGCGTCMEEKHDA